MVETTDILKRIVVKLERQRDRGSGADYGDLDVEGAYDCALWSVIFAIEETLSEIEREDAAQDVRPLV